MLDGEKPSHSACAEVNTFFGGLAVGWAPGAAPELPMEHWGVGGRDNIPPRTRPSTTNPSPRGGAGVRGRRSEVSIR